MENLVSVKIRQRPVGRGRYSLRRPGIRPHRGEWQRLSDERRPLEMPLAAAKFAWRVADARARLRAGEGQESVRAVHGSVVVREATADGKQ